MFCLCLLTTAACSAATTNLVSMADTSVFEPSPNNNLGGMDFVSAGVTSQGKRTRALMRFDVAGAIPAGSSITSASLAIRYLQGGGTGQSYEMHRMLVPWVEGTGVGLVPGTGNVGAPANPGEVTWQSRAHGSAGWGSPGGQSGVDFLSGASASATLALSGLVFSSAGMAADVQLWLDTPGDNNGWIILLTGETTSSSASRLGSREGTAKPTLSITYTLPASPTPPDIFALASLGSQLRFSFTTQADKTYAVESRSSLDSGWSTLSTFPSVPTNSVVHFTNSVSGNERYFRIRTP
jgi:hypothetical protein